MRNLIFLVVIALAGLSSSLAQEGEASDASIDARELEIAETIRCVVCKNQSIAQSDAELARDLRAILRERLEAGDTDVEARDYIVERYGEFVLLKPTFSGKNFLLWAGPFMVLILAIFGGIVFIVTRRNIPAGNPSLTPEERSELDAFLKQKE
ncbi:cytochrome c-type biogenesis protein [Parvularcula marina]|uniref:Cytochrome c-type biogenesis protein n=1 Tax=Parvularcula marina TaxID=2292771 RepID=A0A371RJH3_9PROT|nr:cytochrome c-type biogenesis protein [Parvularcula marina]RFB05592.1 cytochrome c-type biogenesis protein CcmH [Parvularcula marina]